MWWERERNKNEEAVLVQHGTDVIEKEYDREHEKVNLILI